MGDAYDDIEDRMWRQIENPGVPPYKPGHILRRRRMIHAAALEQTEDREENRRNNLRRRQMKTKNELANVAASTSDELVTVHGLYKNGDRTYSFLCPVDLAETIGEGDHVVVSHSDVPAKVITVTRVDAECEMDDLSLTYQWVMCRLDMGRLAMLRDWHRSLGEDMHRRQRKRMRQQMMQEMGGDVQGVLPLPGGRQIEDAEVVE